MTLNLDSILKIQDLKGSNILLGVCGGVAAYKAAVLVRDLRQLGANVRVVMTESAQAFISPMSFHALSGEPVHCRLFDAGAVQGMGHIELARWADCMLVAPASANSIAKFAMGLADDLLSTLALASQAPLIICPAMNTHMWSHPATQDNVLRLMQRGVQFIGPDEGVQACGDQGLGRMAEVEDIVAHLRLGAAHLCLQGREILITAGPTQEAIDPVRYLTNRSSGKMGYALAQAAVVAGARVTLISGPTALAKPLGVQRINVRTAQEMLQAAMANLKPGMIVIASAAVADFAPKRVATSKLKRHHETELTLTLEKNPDILASLVATGLASMLIGFAAETDDLLLNAETKRVAKQLDMIIANSVGEDRGFDSDVNQLSLCLANQTIELAQNHKLILSAQVMLILAQLLNKSYRKVYESVYSN